MPSPYFSEKQQDGESRTAYNAKARQFNNKVYAQRDRERHLASPIGEFETRLKKIQDGNTVDGFQQFESPVFSGPSNADAPDRSVSDSMWDELNTYNPSATKLRNPRANKVSLQMGDETMTDSQRDEVIGHAARQHVQGQPLRATINGKSYEMPQSGPRVSTAKAKSYLALVQQEKDAALRREAEEHARIRADRKDKIAEDTAQANLDWVKTQQQGYVDDRKYNRGRDAANDMFADAARAKAAHFASTAHDRERLQRLIDDPNTDPYKKADLERRLAALNMTESSGPIQSNLVTGRVANALNKSVDLANDPTYAPTKTDLDKYAIAQKRNALDATIQNQNIIKDTISLDPELSTAMDGVRTDLARIQKEGLNNKIGRWLDNAVTAVGRGVGFNNPYKDFELSDPQVKWVSKSVDQLAAMVAQKTGQSLAAAKAFVLQDLRKSAAGDDAAATQIQNAMR